MDSARFGRVLGKGARHAARTLLEAADAAAAPSPSAREQAGGGTAAGARRRQPVVIPPQGRGTGTGTARAGTARAGAAGAGTARAAGIAEGGRRFGRAVWEPTARVGGVLWLEFTGTFFGLFAAVSGVAAWRLRAGMPVATSNAHQVRQEFLIAVCLTGLFAYFCISSFVRARARSRR